MYLYSYGMNEWMNGSFYLMLEATQNYMYLDLGEDP